MSDIFYMPDPVTVITNLGPGKLRVGGWSNRVDHFWIDAEGSSSPSPHVQKVFVYSEDPATVIRVQWAAKYKHGQTDRCFDNPAPKNTDEPWIVELLAPERDVWLRVLDLGTHGGTMPLSYTMPRALAVAGVLRLLPAAPTVRIANWVDGKYIAL